MSEEEKAKSAIDEIFSISKMLETFEKRLIIVDNNIKLLNNKVSKLSKKIEDGSFNDKVVARPTATAPSVGAKTIAARSKELVIGDIKLFGYIHTKLNTPIKGVNVTIYGQDGKIIKEKVTNDDGYWSVRLPTGRYGVEYNHKFGNRKFKPINRTVELIDKMTELEVV